jgi:hypothetical protein
VTTVTEPGQKFVDIAGDQVMPEMKCVRYVMEPQKRPVPHAGALGIWNCRKVMRKRTITDHGRRKSGTDSNIEKLNTPIRW